jgi:hypothetical protein
MCTVCIEKGSNISVYANLLSRSPDASFYTVNEPCTDPNCTCDHDDQDALCQECEGWLCEHHWNEAVKQKLAVNNHAVKKCQGCIVHAIANAVAAKQK